tara:strand:- start:1528 stop:2175 length:648 start_codon:yes stop_codon:yes gene_type:complete
MSLDTVSITFILVNLAYLMTFTALSIKEVLWLRVVLACSHSMIFINNYYYAQNYNVAVWNFIFILVNVIQVVRIYDDRKPRMIPEDMKDLYRGIFSTFTSKEFLYFMNLGEKEIINKQKLISLGDHQKDLLLVLKGDALVMREGKHLAKLNRGKFLGEISFLTDQPASADVYAKDELQYIKWDQSKIRAIKISNNAFWAKLNSVLTNDLTSKITS